MKRLIFVLVVFLSAISAKAHQPEISSFTLFEQHPGKWMLQLNASMTAFEYEVHTRFGQDAYTSPEEFNQLLLTHLREHITIEVNGQDVALDNGIVKLGHATTVLFELTGVPEHVEDVFVMNNGFEDIHNSQVIFSIVKEGLDKSRFMLSEVNDFQTHLSLQHTQILLAETALNNSWATLSIPVGAVLLFGFLLLKRRSKKRNVVAGLD